MCITISRSRANIVCVLLLLEDYYCMCITAFVDSYYCMCITSTKRFVV